MRSIAKSLLITIIVSIGIMLFTNFIYFFPWYMTMVVETFNVAQVAANDNYVKQKDYDEALERLMKRPIYKKENTDVKIEVWNEDGDEAVGYDDESYYVNEPLDAKPYRQRGKEITVTISAKYPLTITLWGREYRRDVDASFTLKTTGLKHYKDLEYYFQ